MKNEIHYAGFWRRFVAIIIDVLLLYVVLGIGIAIILAITTGLGAVVGVVEPFGVLSILLVALLALIGPYVWFAIFESSAWQATPGKRALSLKVTNEEGGPISFWNALGRNAGKILSGLIFYIGYMMAGWTRRKQALHDLMAGCLVIREV